MTWLSVGWLSLFIVVLFIDVWLFHLYFESNDKRKLLFAIAFLSAPISHIYPAVGYHWLESSLLLGNLYYWAALPLMVAIFIAVVESMYKLEDFDRVFKIFLVFFVFSFISILIPVSIEGVMSVAKRVVAVGVIIATTYVFIKTRDQSTLLFLPSLICFTVAGMAQAKNMGELSIFSYFMANTFLILVFIVASPSAKKDKRGIGSYFSLEKKFETAKKALHESEEKYRTIVENTSDAIMITQPDGTISYMAPSSEKVLGYRPEELIGKQPWIIHPDDVEMVKEVHYQALKECNGSNLEYRIITKQKEAKWVSHSFSPILDDGKLKMIISSVKDVNQRKIAEVKLREKVEALKRNEVATLSIMEDLKIAKGELSVFNKELENKIWERTAEVEHLLRQKDEFVNQLGHDLKNPLGPLINLLPVLEEDETDPERKKIFEVLNRNTRHMKNLVTKTIQLAKLNSSSVKLSFEDTKLLSEIDDIIEKGKLLFEENNIEIDNKTSDDIMVKGDKLRLTELFDNIINNAVKYSPDGGTITIDAKQDKDSVTVSIKDTGAGMNGEQLSHIFDEFYKADWARHDFDSSGLGLSICKRIVEKHGGKIWAESEGLGKGITMFFTIPASSEKQEDKKQ
ncbi:MAG: PAS domain-containing sensor histidine kinase [Candidatus Thermoplasmatota archaeon]|nr:PAS domain-containing sensor histidine kinase [Candidatus Thermoplasmatota archaeon]